MPCPRTRRPPAPFNESSLRVRWMPIALSNAAANCRPLRTGNIAQSTLVAAASWAGRRCHGRPFSREQTKDCRHRCSQDDHCPQLSSQSVKSPEANAEAAKRPPAAYHPASVSTASRSARSFSRSTAPSGRASHSARAARARSGSPRARASSARMSSAALALAPARDPRHPAYRHLPVRPAQRLEERAVQPLDLGHDPQTGPDHLRAVAVRPPVEVQVGLAAAEGRVDVRGGLLVGDLETEQRIEVEDLGQGRARENGDGGLGTHRGPSSRLTVGCQSAESPSPATAVHLQLVAHVGRRARGARGPSGAEGRRFRALAA